MRIVLRSPEQQPTEKKLQQIQQVREVVASYFPGETATASGLFVLMARIIESLLSEQLRSFLWACAGTVV
ncbi:MAG: hypothetical protein ACK58T_19435, partial [Phycisphaerae bacterium]